MEADDLYGLPLSEFTAARDKLAKEQQDQEIRRLKKPTLPAWVVNQLARNEKPAVRRLLKAGEGLRKAHGTPRREQLQAATEKERAAVADLVELAKPLLGTAGAANLERVRNTLHAVATDDALREELAAGRVVRDREAVGLGPLGVAGRPVAPKAGDKRDAAKRRKLREARATAERATKALAAAETALERARRDAEEAERTLRDRQRSLDQARRDAENAAGAVRDAEF